MRRRSENIDIDNLIVIGAELIPNPPPKTFFGHVRYWLIKIVKIKKTLGIKVK